MLVVLCCCWCRLSRTTPVGSLLLLLAGEQKYCCCWRAGLLLLLVGWMSAAVVFVLLLMQARLLLLILVFWWCDLPAWSLFQLCAMSGRRNTRPFCSRCRNTGRPQPSGGVEAAPPLAVARVPGCIQWPRPVQPRSERTRPRPK